MATNEEILRLLEKAGERQYGGERVSQLEHALQCAWLAEQAESTPALITASLLHDLGHLLDPLEKTEGKTRDFRHEEIGWHYLRDLFGPPVVEPILLHVAAKRYLCQADPTYWDTLSPVSKHTLELQGGVFSHAEATEFLSRPFAPDGIQLRIWDDLAKTPGQPTPDLAHFAQIMLAAQ